VWDTKRFAEINLNKKRICIVFSTNVDMRVFSTSQEGISGTKNQLLWLCSKITAVNQSHYRPEVPRGFKEVKIPRLRDNGPECW